MASVLYRLGRFTFRRRRLVLALWLAVLVALGTAASTLSGQFSNEFSIPGTESQEAFDPLERQLVRELSRRLGGGAPILPHLLANAVLAALRAAVEAWLAARDADFQQVLGECFDVLAHAGLSLAGRPRASPVRP